MVSVKEEELNCLTEEELETLCLKLLRCHSLDVRTMASFARYMDKRESERRRK